MTAQMLLVWPINEPWRGRLALVDEAVDDIDALVQEQGYQVAGIPVDWDIKPGPTVPGWAVWRLVLTCTVPVAPLAAAALEEAA